MKSKLEEILNNVIDDFNTKWRSHEEKSDGISKYIDEILALQQTPVMESDCDHEWLNHSFDHFGFLQEQICDKCGAKQSVP